MRADPIAETALETASSWYESHRSKKGHVNTNVMTGGIAVAELLREHFPLTEESVKSENGSQVKGLSGSMIKRILAKNGEKRQFTSEGGRTSRKTLPMAIELALSLTKALAPFNPDKQSLEATADVLQAYFVKRIEADYFGKKKLKADLDASKPVSALVANVLRGARARADQPTGTVAQHLVGAKLELRFPNLAVGRDKASTADLQTDRQGDFQLGTTAFHVTVAPSAKLSDRVTANIQNGFRPVVLVPESSVAFATGLFQSEGLGERVAVQSIETFVGTNIEELGSYDAEIIRLGIAKLVRRYNERITECETDQSLRIEEPAWMTSLLDTVQDTVRF